MRKRKIRPPKVEMEFADLNPAAYGGSSVLARTAWRFGLFELLAGAVRVEGAQPRRDRRGDAAGESSHAWRGATVRCGTATRCAPTASPGRCAGCATFWTRAGRRVAGTAAGHALSVTAMHLSRHLYRLPRTTMAACAALGIFTASAATNDTDSREILVIGPAGFTPGEVGDIGRLGNVRRVTATYKGRMNIHHREAQLEALVIAQDGEPTAELSANAAWPLETGTFIAERDSVDGNRVAVIGGPVRDRLFGSDVSAIGKNIVIEDESFTVKGVLDPHPPFVDADIPDAASIPLATRVYVPLRTGVGVLFREARPSLLRVSIEDSGHLDQTTGEIRELLVGRHGQAIQVEPVAVPRSVSPK